MGTHGSHAVGLLLLLLCPMLCRYILVYPAGCDVCNHLSLFLCVADYDKLLPGMAAILQYSMGGWQVGCRGPAAGPGAMHGA